MIGKLVSTGFRVATLPARLTFRSVRALAMTPAEASRLVESMRDASEQAVREFSRCWPVSMPRWASRPRI